jgi:hypothetical protein
MSREGMFGDRQLLDQVCTFPYLRNLGGASGRSFGRTISLGAGLLHAR